MRVGVRVRGAGRGGELVCRRFTPVRVLSSDVNNTCATLTIGGDLASNRLPGTFTLTGATLNDRSVYENAPHQLHFYYYRQGAVAYWAAGPELGSSRAMTFVVDASIDPRYITHAWTSWIGGKWVKDTSVRLTCV